MKPDQMNRAQLEQVAAEQAQAMYRLRKAIGIVGILLPILLLSGVWLFDVTMQLSISRFFFTGMRDVLVLSLACVGVFLIGYHGHDPEDNALLSDWRVSTTAGVTAIGVALIPTLCVDICYEPLTLFDGLITGDKLQGALHFGSAAIFLICLAVFCLRLFVKSDVPPEQQPADKRLRNRIYRCCGWVILAMIAALLLFKFIFASIGHGWDAAWNFTFWAESIAVWAFGISWLIKGEALRGRPTAFLYGDQP